MNRRGFFKSVAGAAGMVVLPAVAAERSVIEWFEANFDCKMGEPKAFTTHTDGSPVEYYTYKLGAQQFAQGAELSGMFLSAFKDTLVAHPDLYGSRLYWRLKEKIQYGVDRGFVEHFDVDADGGFVPRIEWRSAIAYLRTRIAIPEMQKRSGCHADVLFKREGSLGVVLL